MMAGAKCGEAGWPGDGEKIGGCEVVVVPDWLLRRLIGNQTAVLVPPEAAAIIRKALADGALPKKGGE